MTTKTRKRAATRKPRKAERKDEPEVEVVEVLPALDPALIPARLAWLKGVRDPGAAMRVAVNNPTHHIFITSPR